MSKLTEADCSNRNVLTDSEAVAFELDAFCLAAELVKVPNSGLKRYQESSSVSSIILRWVPIGLPNARGHLQIQISSDRLRPGFYAERASSRTNGVG